MIKCSLDSFQKSLKASIEAATFVKMTLGKYRGDADVNQCRIALVSIREQLQLRFVFQHQTKDITKNDSIEVGLNRIERMLGNEFFSGHLFTTEADHSIHFNKRGIPRLSTATATFPSRPSTEHNRKKSYLVEATSDYLMHLNVTDRQGVAKPSMAAKFKQVCRFVEIIDSLIRESVLSDRTEVTAVDIGCGKGYLTFALYEHLTNRLGKAAVVRGVERRQDLVDFCNKTASQVRFRQLSFDACEAKSIDVTPTDILIALHACDTATDEAIYYGIRANASIIVCAPCCQHEIAPQLTDCSPSLNAITKFGLLKQRQADIVTDAARALLLEASGYRVKVLEFVSVEHTSKNLMLAGVRCGLVDCQASMAQYLEQKRLFGFKSHHLESLLSR